MFKYLLTLLLSTAFFFNAYAQSATDTLIYYVKNNGNVVQANDEADYTLVILPGTQGDKQILYPVLAFYPDGKRKMIGTSTVRSSTIILNGTLMMFFPNGKRSAVTMFEKGVPVGEEITYYPNGSMYTRKKFEKSKTILLECRDSTGVILAKEGKGKWLMFDQSFSSLMAEGSVENGSVKGLWDNFFAASSYLFLPFIALPYKDETNLITLSNRISLDSINLPGVNNFIHTLKNFIDINISEPDKRRIAGRQMYVNLSLKSDGSLYDITVARCPSDELAKELVRVVKLSSPWPRDYIKKNLLRTPVILPVYFPADSLASDTTANEVFTKTDIQPNFPGGLERFYEFLSRNVNYPQHERENNITGKVVTTFVVEKDGSIANVHVLRTPSMGLAEESLRVIRKSPKWIAGVYNGKPVRVKFTVPMGFSLGTSSASIIIDNIPQH